MLSAIAEQYGGYTFDRDCQSKVLDPISVLNFLSDPAAGLKPYWFESVSPVYFDYYLHKVAEQNWGLELLPVLFIDEDAPVITDAGELDGFIGNVRERKFWSEGEYCMVGIDPYVILYQGGLLTIRRAGLELPGHSADEITMHLGFANRFIKEGLLSMALCKLTAGRIKTLCDLEGKYKDETYKALRRGRLKVLKSLFAKILSLFDPKVLQRLDAFTLRDVIKFVPALSGCKVWTEEYPSSRSALLFIQDENKVHVLSIEAVWQASDPGCALKAVSYGAECSGCFRTVGKIKKSGLDLITRDSRAAQRRLKAEQ